MLHNRTTVHWVKSKWEMIYNTATLGWLSKKLLRWYATLTFKSQSTTTTMSSLINLLTSKETSLEAETFLMDRSHVCARLRGKYGRNDCKMYMAVSRNSIKVARNPWHKIPLWTQKGSIHENLYSLPESLRIAFYFPPFACVKICDLRFVDWANLLLQESKGQTYGLSPVWIRTWVRRLKSNENLLPQPSNVHCYENKKKYYYTNEHGHFFKLHYAKDIVLTWHPTLWVFQPRNVLS